MIAHNPLLRAMLVVVAFWYVVLYAITAAKGMPVWRLLHAAPVSVLLAVVGLAGGMGYVLMFRRGHVRAVGSAVHAGARLREASYSLGETIWVPASAQSSAMDGLLEQQPWWPAIRDRSPVHARAIREAYRVMATRPRLPASPYPGGHGGRTLIEHSLAVATQMLIEAPGWRYEGQRNKRGEIRVPLRDGGPHSFTGDDAPLLVLTGLVHDIGKLGCYQPMPGQNIGAQDGPVLRVIEAKPMHDAEGARILRTIPGIMALPPADRTAVITAVGYYHHPFGMPKAGWLGDRIRSLTELLAHTDVQVGKAEGHVLLDADERAREQEDDDYETGAATARLDPEATAAAMGKAEDESLDDHLEKMFKQAAESEAQARKKHPAAREVAAAASVPFALDTFMRMIREPGAVNGSANGARVAWKEGEWVYVMDGPFRNRLKNAPWVNKAWANSAEQPLEPASGNAAPYIAELANLLAGMGDLLTTFEGETFAPARSLFRMSINEGEKTIPVFVVRTRAIPGLDGLPDAGKTFCLIEPLWGRHQARNKVPPKRPPEAAALPASPPTPTAADDDGGFGFDASDLPFAEIGRAATPEAPTRPEPPEPEAATPPPASPEVAEPPMVAPDAWVMLADVLEASGGLFTEGVKIGKIRGASHALIPVDEPLGERTARAAAEIMGVAIEDAKESLRPVKAGAGCVLYYPVPISEAVAERMRERTRGDSGG